MNDDLTHPVPRLARLALALYPAAWRARYGDEVLGLLADSGCGPRQIASLAWRAIPARISPPRHLYDRPARMRASLASVLTGWAILTGFGLVFAQLTQLQGYAPAGHPIVTVCYGIFDAALLLSGLAVALSGLPLWLLMLRRARRNRDAVATGALLTPIVAPASYLAGLAALGGLIRHPDGMSQGWFLVITLAGFGAAFAAAAGPGLALRRLRPRGPAVRLAAAGGAVATSLILIASAASAVATIGLSVWEPGFAGYHNGAGPAIFLALMALIAAGTSASAVRGVRAAATASSSAPLA